MFFKKVEYSIAILIILFLEFVFPNPIDDGEYQFCPFASLKKKKIAADTKFTEFYTVATHPIDRPDWVPAEGPPEERIQNFWNSKAQTTLRDIINQKQNTNIAKNVIVFVGILEISVKIFKNYQILSSR
jgi:hypothetical protein